ncbi:hypothetical protein SAPIO_CDS4613 [Scedosporium apiospermum]|uniref:Uncharacterized protein n=1 Tax=Pseudallescheria apiosperma TaxID=563466 RepID=A0A084G7X0_PSEDA|nr:uncharacterized protein SAPIO_CDS4613 [Scedosporium apiospermum]KEZ43432.1 hypothetical protein SAPIO_CDS4613 [Scedosporium apiospermum]
MGYTHYWTIKDAASWRKCLPQLVDDSGLIIKHSGVAICGNDYDLPPMLDKDEGISINGKDDGFEPFCLALDEGFDFCKTGRRPYDLVVCAILLRAHQLAPKVLDIHSDGRWNEVGWRNARELINQLWPDEAVTCPWGDAPDE